MLFTLSLGNYALMYWANIYLARHLPMGAFDDYSVAISVVTLLSTLATLGLEKYALRIIALYIERQNWPRLRGFWVFSLRSIVLFSLLLMGVMSLGLESFLLWQQADFHIAIIIYAGFLPVIAVCLFLIEVITVFGAQILALVLYRFFLPAVFLLFISLLNDFHLDITAVSAVLCFGIAWCLTLAGLLICAKTFGPDALQQIKANRRGGRWWLKKSLPLLVSSLMMTILTSAGTIILEILHPSESVVGIYAVVMQTTALISVIGTSTNRYYLPMLVVLLERHEPQKIHALLNKRMMLFGSFILVFLGLIVTRGQQILTLFGADFSEGYQALCISACGAVIMALYSYAPYYLQFMGRNRLVIGSLSITAISMVILSFILGRQYGATGVSLAFTLPTLLLFTSLKWLASRHMCQYLAIKNR